MKNPLIMSIVCALMWGVWPIITNVSKASASYISMMLSLSTAVCVVTYLVFKSQAVSALSGAYSATDQKTFWLPILAGVMNAVGIILYGFILSKDSGFDATKYVVIITAMLPIIAMIAGHFIIGSQVTFQKVIGLVFACIGIYFLNKK